MLNSSSHAIHVAAVLSLIQYFLSTGCKGGKKSLLSGGLLSSNNDKVLFRENEPALDWVSKNEEVDKVALTQKRVMKVRGYLGSFQTSMMEYFYENTWKPNSVNYFRINALSSISEKVLKTFLEMLIKSKK